MANTNIGGFRFVKMRNGSSTPVVEVYPVASAYGTGIFRGDPVKLVTDGTIEVAAAGDTDILGIADGVEQYKGTDGIMRRGNYLPASTSFNGGLAGPEVSLVRVILARDAVFEVDADEGTTITTVAAAYDVIGENCDHVATAAGSTTTGRSGYELDISTNNTTAAQWRVVGVSKDVLNDLTLTKAKYLVEVNESLQPQFSTTGD